MTPPLPGWSVIPPNWARHHRPVANSTMQSPAIFKRISDGPPPYPLPDGWDGSVQIWAANVRMQELKRESQPIPAEQPTSIREYLITAPIDGMPGLRAGERGDTIHVEGRVLSITSIMFGTYEFERDLIAVDNLTQQNPA